MLRLRGLSKLAVGAGVLALASAFGAIVTFSPLFAADKMVATPNDPAVLTAEPPPPVDVLPTRDLTLEGAPSAPPEATSEPSDPPASAEAAPAAPNDPATGSPPAAASDPAAKAEDPAAKYEGAPDAAENPAASAQAPPETPGDSAAAAEAPADSSTYIAVDVTGYSPPGNGRVEAIVKLNDPASDSATEIGRFGFYPNAPFKAADPADALRFMFKVDPAELKQYGDAKPKITVELVPSGEGAAGEGARLELGKAIVVRAAVPEEQDRPVATAQTPAVVTAKVAAPDPSEELGTRSVEPQATYLSVEVMGYTPPKEGSVQAVVKIGDPETGATKEVGRFGIFPNSPFQVQDPLDAQRFMFKVEESDLKREGDAQPKVIVDLVPRQGEKAEGARLEVGQALIEKR